MNMCEIMSLNDQSSLWIILRIVNLPEAPVGDSRRGCANKSREGVATVLVVFSSTPTVFISMMSWYYLYATWSLLPDQRL